MIRSQARAQTYAKVEVHLPQDDVRRVVRDGAVEERQDERDVGVLDLELPVDVRSVGPVSISGLLLLRRGHEVSKALGGGRAEFMEAHKFEFFGLPLGHGLERRSVEFVRSGEEGAIVVVVFAGDEGRVRCEGVLDACFGVNKLSECVSRVEIEFTDVRNAQTSQVECIECFDLLQTVFWGGGGVSEVSLAR